MNKSQTILDLADAGQSVSQIAAACSVSPGYVYGILRTERPARQRKARTRTSSKRTLALGLHAQGIAIGRIAFLCQCSRAYVYRIVGESDAE